MTERGPYRTTYVAMLNDCDYQALTASERLLLFTLKHHPQGNVAGIFPCYLDALEAYTALCRPELEAALAGLEAGRWIAREGPIVWIRNQLRFEPTYSLADPKKVIGVRKLLATLPRLWIVRKFCEYYGIGLEDLRLPSQPGATASAWLRSTPDEPAAEAPRPLRSPFEALSPAPAVSIAGTGPLARAGGSPSGSCSESAEDRRSEPEANPDPPVLELPCVGKGSHCFVVRASFVREAAEAYPGTDIEAELRKARVWLFANPSRQKTARGMPRFLNAWIARAQDRPGLSAGAPRASPESRASDPKGYTGLREWWQSDRNMEVPLDGNQS